MPAVTALEKDLVAVEHVLEFPRTETAPPVMIAKEKYWKREKRRRTLHDKGVKKNRTVKGMEDSQ